MSLCRNKGSQRESACFRLAPGAEFHKYYVKKRMNKNKNKTPVTRWVNRGYGQFCSGQEIGYLIQMLAFPETTLVFKLMFMIHNNLFLLQLSMPSDEQFCIFQKLVYIRRLLFPLISVGDKNIGIAMI